MGSRQADDDQRDQDVVAAAAGDTVALTRLLMRHHYRLRSIVQRSFKVSGAVDVDDVVQDAMVDIFRSIGSLETATIAGFVGWSKRIVRNRVAQVHRRNLARRRGGGQVQQESTEQTQQLIEGFFRVSRSPRSWLANKELLGLIPLWLEGLDELSRQVIRMRFVDEQDYESIGLRFGKTPEAVRMIVMRALRQLRKLAIEPGEGMP